MKKILSYLVSVLAIVAIAIIVLGQNKDKPIVLVKDNINFKPLPIKLNKTNDTECAMLIKSNKNAAEAISPDGTTWFFDDPGCMVKWLAKKSWKNKAKLWVHTIDTNRWIDATKAHYGTTDHTQMHYGFGAREQKTKQTINFTQMQERIKNNQTMENPKYRKKLLDNK